MKEAIDLATGDMVLLPEERARVDRSMAMTVEMFQQKAAQLEEIATRNLREGQACRNRLADVEKTLARLEAASAGHKEYKHQHRELVRAHRLLRLEHGALLYKYSQLVKQL